MHKYQIIRQIISAIFFLPGRPVEAAAAEKVEVDVGNRLSRVLPAVKHQPITGVQLFFFGDFWSNFKNMPEYCRAFFGGLFKRFVMLFWDYDNVSRRLRGDINKSQN